jgi:hypothetical protein
LEVNVRRKDNGAQQAERHVQQGKTRFLLSKRLNEPMRHFQAQKQLTGINFLYVNLLRIKIIQQQHSGICLL